MHQERQDMQDDSLQECERKFRDACMRIIQKKHAKSPRKKLFENAGLAQKIALRPSMIDRACLKKSVVSSTPMPHNRQQPFTPDSSSGSISSINESIKDKVFTNSQSIKNVDRLNLSKSQNGPVISISSNISQDKEQNTLSSLKNNKSVHELAANKSSTNADANNSKSQTLDKIISKLVLNRSVSATVPDTSNKNVQTSGNSTRRNKQPSYPKKLSRSLFRKNTKTEVRQTQTGRSLMGEISNGRNSGSSSSEHSDQSTTLRSCESKEILATNITCDKNEVSSSDEAANAVPDEAANAVPDKGLPWRASSGLQDPLHAVVTCMTRIGDSVEDDTFLPKRPKTKKEFINKKKKVGNNGGKKEKLNKSIKGEKIGKEKRKVVEKESTKNKVKSVARTSSESSGLSVKNTPDNNNELSTDDSFLSVINKRRHSPTINVKSSGRDVLSNRQIRDKENNNKTFQINSLQKQQSVNEIHHADDLHNDESSLNKTVTRSMLRIKEQSKRIKEDVGSKNLVFDKSNIEVPRNERGHQKSVNKCKNRLVDKEDGRSLNDIHSEEDRGKAKEINVTLMRKQGKAKEKGQHDIFQDDLIGDAQASISNSTVTETRRKASPVKQHSSKKNQASADMHSEKDRGKVKEKAASSKQKSGKVKEKARDDILQDDLINDAQTSTSDSMMTETRGKASPVKQHNSKNKRGSANIQTDEPEVSQDVLCEGVDTSIPSKFQRVINEESFSRKQINKTEKSKMSITQNNRSTDNVKVGSKNKQNNSKKKPKKPDVVEDIVPQDASDQECEVQNSPYLNNSKRRKKKYHELSTDNTRKEISMDLMKAESNQKKSKKNKNGAGVPEITESSYLDSGFGASSQQLQPFKIPTTIKNRVPKEVQSIKPTEPSSPRRSTRERRPPPLKSAGIIFCNTQRECERLTCTSRNRPEIEDSVVSQKIPVSGTRERRPPPLKSAGIIFCDTQRECERLTCTSTNRPEIEDSVVSQKIPVSGRSYKRKTTRRPSVQSTATTFAPIAEINNEVNFDTVDDLQVTAKPSTSKASKENVKNKNYVLNGRTQKRRNTKTSGKKIMKSLSRTLENASSDLNNILNICDGDKIRTIKWVSDNLRYSDLKGMPGVSASVTTNFPTGLLKIDGGKSKSRQVTSLYQLYFCVLQGRGQVGVQDKCKVLKRHESFIVPPGCEYYINNLNANVPLILFFTKIQKSL